jgi:hypothetical protein
MVRIALLLTAAALAVGCSMTPTVTKVSTTMTPKEIADAGLECKQLTAIDTNIPRTICAGPKTWAAYEAKARAATDELLAEGRKLPNAGGFNRN